jgi:hypothetical protein
MATMDDIVSDAGIVLFVQRRGHKGMIFAWQQRGGHWIRQPESDVSN